ncbi:Transthyretin-like family protein [Teladorsagia circumcincta]|uniref:Transthyretin-like family protein n=1 Tax=Teladorsagia circumcincta TaxID=45464 RepID=A0A2G9TRE1_TELCI|nr:Transthyretin-like family protein [Teladorsagia circumcincta]
MLQYLIVLLGCSAVMGSRDQSIAVTGRLVCGTEPADGVRVVLIDEDIDVPLLSWLDPHDVLDQGYSDSNGDFRLVGSTEELTAMEPVLEIYHKCNDGDGLRKVRFGLPDQYITAGKVPEKTVDIGLVNLELVYKDETREDVSVFDEITSVEPSSVQ